MKLIVVPPDTSTVLLKALEAAGVHPQDVGGFQIMATRLCPPDRCYILDAKPLELIKPAPPIEWNNEPAFFMERMVFSMDWFSGLNWRPRPKPWYRRWWKSLRDWWHWAYEDFKATFDHMWQ